MALDLIAVSSNGGNAQNPTCPVPTTGTGGTVAAGDLLMMTVATGAAVHTSPAGWTDEVQIGTSSEITYVVFKFAAAGDLGGTITFSQGGTTPTRIAIRAYRPSGSDAIDTSNPIDVTSFISTGSSASITSPSTTAPAAGWLVEGATVRGATSYSSSPPAGFIEEIDTTTSSGSPAKAQTSMFKGTGTTLSLLTTGDSMGGHTFTAASSVAAGEQHAYTLFIRKFVTTPTAVTMTADPSLVADLPGPLKAGIYNPAVVMYQAHRGGADILPAETLTAYLDTVNDKFSWEGDAYLLQNSGSDTDDDRLAAVHDTDMVSVPLYQSNGSVVTAGSDVTTTSITTWDTNIYQKHPITNALVHVTRWKGIFEAVRQSTGNGYWPYGRMFAIENKAAGTTTPIINSLKARGLVHFALANTFDYTRCTTLAAAGLHVMWLTTSFATNSAATVKAAGIEWVGWQAGTTGFAAFLSAAHAAGLYVNVYDVQTASQRDTYTAQGVEMISTDRPDLVYPSTAWTGTASLAETAAVTSAGVRATSTGSSIAATATVTSAGTVAKASGATVSETAAVTSAGTKASTGDTALTETAAIASAGLRAATGDSALAETATLTSAGLRAATSTATVAETVSVTSAGLRAATGDAAITGSAVVTAHGNVVSSSGSGSDLNETGTISAAGTLAHTGAAPITETGTISSDGVRATSTGSQVTLSVSISADGTVTHTSGSPVGVTVAVTAVGERGRTGDAAITGTATFTTGGETGHSTGTTLSGGVTISADGTVGHNADTTLVAIVTLLAAGEVETGPVVTPPERTYRIAAESRVCAIEPETRTYQIPAETRTLEAVL